MLPYRDSRLTKISLTLFFIAALGYAYFEARNMLWGPQIEVPANVQSVSDQLITIRGRAQSIVELRIGGRPVPVTEAGDFEEDYLLAEGYNHIVLEAEDRWGREREEVVEVIYTPPHIETAPATTTAQPSPTSPATSTPGSRYTSWIGTLCRSRARC